MYSIHSAVVSLVALVIGLTLGGNAKLEAKKAMSNSSAVVENTCSETRAKFCDDLYISVNGFDFPNPQIDHTADAAQRVKTYFDVCENDFLPAHSQCDLLCAASKDLGSTQAQDFGLTSCTTRRHTLSGASWCYLLKKKIKERMSTYGEAGEAELMDTMQYALRTSCNGK